MKKYIIILAAFSILSCTNKEATKTNAQKTETHEGESEGKHEEEITITQKQFDASKMALGQLSKQKFAEVVKTTGMIDVPPQSKEIITSFYGGFVKKSNLLVGDKVRKGQAVVTIENPEFLTLQQEYLEAKEQLSYLKNEYERQKTLFDEQITSQKKYLKAQSDYKRTNAVYLSLAKKLRMLNINLNKVNQGDFSSTITLYSSINGTVTKVNVSKGTPIATADEIMQIVNIDHIHIELTAFERDAMKIKEGQIINFKIPEASDKVYQAEVHLVSKIVDEASRTIKIHGHLLKETKNTFHIGMFVEAEIEVSNTELLALPNTAILEEDEHKVAFFLEEQKEGHYIFEPIEITIGKSNGTYTAIVSDNIKPTDKILVKGGYSLVGAEGGGHSH